MSSWKNSSSTGSSNSSSNSGGWSGKTDFPSYPGDLGGNTFTYSTPSICNDRVCVNGNVSASTSNTPSGGQ